MIFLDSLKLFGGSDRITNSNNLNCINNNNNNDRSNNNNNSNKH